MANQTVPSPPGDLVPRGRGRRFWREVLGGFDANPREIELLAECCRMLDQLDAIRDALEGEPLVVNGKTHPLLIESRLLRSELRLALSSLGWDDEPDPIRRDRARKGARGRWGT